MSNPVRTFATSLRDYKELSIRATGLSAKSKNISALFLVEKAQHWNGFDQVLAKISNANSRANLKKDFEKQHADWVLQHRKKTNDNRWQYLRELQAIRDESRQIIDLWKSPAQVATLEGIGSEERSRYLEQCKGLGKASLASLALKAELENNRALASTLIALNDDLSTDKRPFSSHDLAEKIWSEDIKQAKEAHLQICRAYELALSENRKCEGWGENKITRLERSIRFRDVPTHDIPDIDAYTIDPKDFGVGPAA